MTTYTEERTLPCRTRIRSAWQEGTYWHLSARGLTWVVLCLPLDSAAYDANLTRSDRYATSAGAIDTTGGRVIGIMDLAPPPGASAISFRGLVHGPWSHRVPVASLTCRRQ